MVVTAGEKHSITSCEHIELILAVIQRVELKLLILYVCVCVCAHDKASLGLDLETFHPLFIPVVLVSLLRPPIRTTQNQ